MVNKDVIEKVDRINKRLNWLDGISELMKAINHEAEAGLALNNVGWLIGDLVYEVQEDVASIWESLGGNVEKGGN